MKRKSTFFAGAFIAAALLLSGCQNFLNANAEAREKLQAEVAYAKAKDIRLNFYTEDSEKFTYTESLSQAKKGYAFEIKYRLLNANYYINFWQFKSGNVLLVENKDYVIENNYDDGIKRIKILSDCSSVEISPKLRMYPTLKFDTPKESVTVKGSIDNPVSGSMIITRAKEEVVLYKMADGYKPGMLKFTCNGVDVGNCFDVTNDISDPNKKIIKMISEPEVEGIVTVETTAIPSGSSSGSSGPVIDLSRCGITGKSYTLYDNIRRYTLASPEEEVSVSLPLTTGNLSKYRVIERCISISSNQAYKNIDDKWVINKTNGKTVYSKYNEFVLSEARETDFYTDKTTSASQVKVKANVMKGGLHRWEIYAIDNNNVQSANPFIFEAMITTTVPRFLNSGNDGVFIDNLFTGSDYFGFQTLPPHWISEGIVKKVSTNIWKLVSASELKYKFFYSLESSTGVENNVVDFYDFYSEEKQSNTYFSYVIKDLKRRTSYQVSFTVIDQYGMINSNPVKFDIMTNRVSSGEIAGFIGKDYSKVKYVSSEEYSKGITAFHPIGFVVSVSPQHIYVASPKNGVAKEMWCNKTNTVLKADNEARYNTFVSLLNDIEDPKEARSLILNFAKEYNSGKTNVNQVVFYATTGSIYYARNMEEYEDADDRNPYLWAFTYEALGAVDWMLPTKKVTDLYKGKNQYITEVSQDGKRKKIVQDRYFSNYITNIKTEDSSISFDNFSTTTWTSTITNGKAKDSAGNEISTWTTSKDIRPVCDLINYDSY